MSLRLKTVRSSRLAPNALIAKTLASLCHAENARAQRLLNAAACTMRASCHNLQRRGALECAYSCEPTIAANL
jgi:hypothetical protein